MTDPNALYGDGINFPFFDLLWSKTCDGDEGRDGRTRRPADGRRDARHLGESGTRKAPILRVPDTVVFLFGQPHQWYFTSKNGGPDKDRTTILRKRKANITLANIEEVLLNKAASRGEARDEDIVAYFICSKESEAEMPRNEQRANFDACRTSVDDGTSCNIEYFNRKALHEFLQHGRHNKSGILQRFVNPHGGRHNSQIRAVWTPRLCVPERRRTKRELHDARFARYERAITFEGPDVHSVPLPLRGTVLAGKVEGTCDAMVRHIDDAIAEHTPESGEEKAPLGVARMVANLKVDGNGKIWILWTSSIRPKGAESDSLSSMQAPSSHPLNMETVVRLPPSIKLTQAPSHNGNVKLENELSFATCPSCTRRDPDLHFQPVPYKTIIQHFQRALEMLEKQDESHPSKAWPPDGSYLKAAGGVGFGALPSQLIRDGENHPKRAFSEETHTIPPVIRHVHPKLRARGYAVYRNDPLFLLKTCRVCEDCFLAYAELTSTSFIHMTRPIQPPADDRHYNFPTEIKSAAHAKGEKKAKDASSGSIPANLFGKDFGNAPELPPAIMEPPETPTTEPGRPSKPLEPKDTLFNTLPTYFPSTEYAKRNLGHMIDLQRMKEEKTHIATSKSPYEEDLVGSLKRGDPQRTALEKGDQ